MSPEIGTLITFLGGFLLFVSFYFVPSIIAALRSHPRRWSIFVLNLLLGWTVVGWVFALVGAVKTHQATQPVSGFVQSVAQTNERLSDDLASIRTVDNPDWKRLRPAIAKWTLGTLIVVGVGVVFLYVGIDAMLSDG